ncbi:MAG TPA: peptidoglycan-binding protein [Candidatus Paceibacterota bacterium]|nr:peptidoglycan-binding protein [Candidatus Paceibacterota bacterium]
MNRAFLYGTLVLFFVVALSCASVGVTSAATTSFNTNHQLYDTGADILALQQFLNAHSFAVATTGPGSLGNETTVFGLHTYQALVAFQSANGLPATGYLGPLTRALIADGTAASSTAPVFSTNTNTNTQSATTTPSTSTTSTSTPPVFNTTPLPGYTSGQIILGVGAPAPTCSISVSSTAIPNGDSITLSWSSQYASSALLNNNVSLATAGSQVFSPTSNTTYTLTVSGAGGTASCSAAAVDVAPVISAVASSTITGASAVISWTTDLPADTQLAYGTTNAYGATTTLNTTLTTTHSVTITGLTQSTVYHFQVRSADAAGNPTYSGDYSFTTAPPLPSLPFATGAKVSAIGDSIIGYNDAADVSAGVDSNSYGEINWAWATDPRFNFDNWYDTSDPTGRNFSGANNGIFSDHLVGSGTGATPGILNRLPAVLSHHPSILIFEGGTNTINSGDGPGENTEAYVESEIDLALSEAREAGVWVILDVMHPRFDWPAGDPRYQELADVNTWIRAQAGREGVYAIWDSTSVFADNNGNQIAAHYMGDNVHQNQTGAQLSGAILLPILQNMISAGSTYNQNPLVGNFIGTTTNMTGTTGTKQASTTGSVATGFALGVTRGNSSVAGSKEVISGSLEKQVMTITPVPGGSSTAYHSVTLTMPQVFSSGNFAAGDWIQAGCYLEIGNTSSIGSARLILQIAQVSTVRSQTYALNTFSPNFITPTTPSMAYWIVTPPLQATTTATFDRAKWSMEIDFPQVATDTPVVKVSSCALRKVSDPRTAWGF